MNNTHPVATQIPGTYGPGGSRAPAGTNGHARTLVHELVPGTHGANAHSSLPRQNQLLASLPEAEWLRWLPLLERVDLSCGQVLLEAGSRPTYLLFPTTAVVSLLYLTQDGGCAEVAVVGNDGVIGIALIMGGHTTPSTAVVQSAGQAYRLRASVVQHETQRSAVALLVLLRYTQTLMAQVAQTAVCNRFHTIDQQLCRRLLMGLDRQSGDALELTQEAAANLLGVRREGVTAAACKLQKAGVIRYHRGRIQVLDRQRLEQRTCECYAVTNPPRPRLLPPPTPDHTAAAAAPWQRWPQAYAA